MKLSIITINLNNATGLKRTMESVISQTSKDFEYIIIDGCSTDGSVDIIKSYTSLAMGINTVVKEDFPKPHAIARMVRQVHADKPSSMPISYWISEPDKGIYHAMNKGIMVAKGEYCQFLNSGDWLVGQDVIERMLQSFNGFNIIYGNMLKKLKNGKFYRDTGPVGEITMLTFYKSTLNHSPAFIKKELFYKYGFYDENLRIVSDWKWYIKVLVLNNETVKYENIDVTCFDIGGISTLNSKFEKEEREKVLNEFIPSKILVDYHENWQNIERTSRICRYTFPHLFFILTERVLFKYEKWINNFNKTINH